MSTTKPKKTNTQPNTNPNTKGLDKIHSGGRYVRNTNGTISAVKEAQAAEPKTLTEKESKHG